MALEVGAIVARLGARVDTDGFDRFDRRLDAARRESRRAVDAELGADVDTRGFDRYERAVKQAEGSSGRLGRAMRSVGPAAAAGVGVAAGAGALVAKSFVDAASDVAESTSKLEAVLGDQSRIIQDFAKSSASTVGISQRAALDAGGTFAALFRNLGQGAEESAKSSVAFTKLAADMASFGNSTPEEALVALQAGLRGEAEPLRRFGVLLDDATLRQAALREGLIKSTKEALDPQTKALAAQSEIFRQSKTQQGDFARTSGGLANQQRILKARLEDVGTAIGRRLLPIALDLVSGLNRMVKQAQAGEGPLIRLRDGAVAVGRGIADATRPAREFAGFMVRLVKATRDGEGALGLLGSTLAGAGAAFAIYRVVRLFTASIVAARGAFVLLNATMRANPIGVVVTVLGAVAGALVLLYRRSETARDVMDSVFRVLKRAVLGFAEAYLGMVSGVLTGIRALVSVGEKLPGIGSKFRGLGDKLDDAKGKLDGWRKSLRDSAKDGDSAGAGLERQRKKVDALRDRLAGLKKGSDAYRETQRELRSETRKLEGALEDAKPAGDKAARGAKNARDGAKGARDAFDDAAATIASSYNVLGEAFDLRPIRYSSRKVSNAGESAFGGVPRRAVGGIPNPGSGSADDHLLVDPRGRPVAMMSGTEGILNTPQMGIVDAALGIANAMGALPYRGLGDLWNSGLRHFAGGGQIVPVPGFPGERANRSILGKIASTVRAFPGLVLTDAFGPGHKSPGHTVTGTAADFGGPDAVMDRAVAALVRAGYLVGYDGRFGSRDWPGHGPRAGQGGSNAHLHVEFGSSGGSVAAPEMPRLRVNGPGRVGRMLQAGADKLRAGAEARLDKAAAALTVPMGGGSGAGAEPGVLAGFRRAIGASGAPPKSRLALWMAGIVESGLRNLPFGDRDSIGALQLRTGLHGAATAGNPYASALAFLTRGFTGRGGAISIAAGNPGMSAGQVAQAVQGSAFPGRYDAVASQARQYLNRGGLLRRFAGGGSLAGSKRKPLPKPGSLAGLSLMAKPLRGLQTDRVDAYEGLRGEVEDLNTRYSLQERTYNLDTEELIRPDGTVDAAAVRERANELKQLVTTRRAIVKRLEKARAVARRIIATYRTLILRYKRARKKAAKKDRPGYTSRINVYGERLSEWDATRRELTLETIPSARLDLRELIGERSEVLGTKAEAADADTDTDTGGDLPDTSAGGDVPSGDAPAGDPPAADAPTGDAAPAAPDPAEIARQVLETVGAYNAARSDLASSFGSNFTTGYGAGGSDPRRFGSAGASAGLDAGAYDVLGQSGGGSAPGARAGVTVVNNFAAPPPDPHTWSAGVGFELANR